MFWRNKNNENFNMNLYNENCFALKQNKHNLYEVFFAMIGNGIVPVCPACGEPLITDSDIQNNPLLVKKGISTLFDLSRHQNDKDVRAFVIQNANVEHIFSSAHGGTSHYGNLVLMHGGCNSRKHAEPDIKGLKKAKDGYTEQFVYISRGKNIHIYELLQTRGFNKLEKVPKYLLDFDFSDENLYHQNNIFNDI